MKKILIHLHLYYVDMWPEMAACLSNVDEEYDLFVTLIDKSQHVRDTVIALAPHAHIIYVENRGYDVAPFLYVLNNVRLEDYSYVVKLHTKRDLPGKANLLGISVSGDLWRKRLLSFVSDGAKFRHSLDFMEAHPQVGMLTHEDLVINIKSDKRAEKHLYRALIRCLEEHGLKQRRFCYVAGAMFLARAACFHRILDTFKPEDFPVSSGHEMQLAHIVERLFGYFVYEAGMVVSSTATPMQQLRVHCQRFLARLLRFFYQKKYTNNGKLLIKLLTIPVYSAKIKHRDSK